MNIICIYIYVDICEPQKIFLHDIYNIYNIYILINHVFKFTMNYYLLILFLE